MTTAVATRSADLKGFLEKHSASIREVATGTLTPERMTRLVCAAASRDPKLAACSPLSILRSMAECAAMGLEPYDGRSLVHIVPRWNNKSKANEATVLVDFRGLIHLATREGLVRNVESRAVYSKDTFEVEYGDTPRIVHRPTWDKDRGEIVAFYAVAFMPDGSKTFDVMALHEVEAIRDRSKDKAAFSPWTTDFVEMGRKTVVRRLAKYLPKSMPLAKALEHQAKTEAGEYFDVEAAPARPGEIAYQDSPQMEEDGDGNRAYVWTKDDVAAFHTACDDLHAACLAAGQSEQEADEAVAFYDIQRREGQHPEKVVNRMAAKCASLEKSA